MWKQLYKIKKLDKGISLDLHGSMLTIKYNTMPRAAGSQFAIQRMLAHDVLDMQTLFSHLPAVIK